MFLHTNTNSACTCVCLTHLTELRHSNIPFTFISSHTTPASLSSKGKKFSNPEPCSRATEFSRYVRRRYRKVQDFDASERTQYLAGPALSLRPRLRLSTRVLDIPGWSHMGIQCCSVQNCECTIITRKLKWWLLYGWLWLVANAVCRNCFVCCLMV